jgi:carboxyl-terminal processing protease
VIGTLRNVMIRLRCDRRSGSRALALAIFFAAAPMHATVGAQDGAATRPRTVAEDLQLFSQVLNQLRVNHPDSLDMHRVLLSAVNGMLRAADPHSYVMPATYLSPSRATAMREGQLVPVPIAFAFVAGTPVVESVAAGTAASRLDIRRGDVLAAVDHAPVTAESAEELELVLAGPPKRLVTLTFEREGTDGAVISVDRAVRREEAPSETAVRAATMLAPGTGYLRVTTFVGDRIAADVDAALRRLEDQGMQRLILDLRDNGGGRVDEASKVAGAFLPAGSVVYTSAGRSDDVVDTVRVTRSFWRSARSYSVAVLVNDGTASASELVAGALQDHDRALIVGQPTFGKALLMRGFPLSDGSALMLVIGQVRTPCGRVIQRAYRGMSSGRYYRLAGAVRDTAGRPSCKTDGGRVVYGGGGIQPDVTLERPAPSPRWWSQLRESDLPAQWAASWVGTATALPKTLDAWLDQAVPPSLLTDFRSYAERKSATVPAGAEADALLLPALRGAVAFQQWGDEGWYRWIAASDPAVVAAIKAVAAAPATLRK